MDTSMPDADSAPSAVEGDTAGKSNQEQEQALAAPPSDSTRLSSAPPTDSESKGSEIIVAPSPMSKNADTADTRGASELPDEDADHTDQDFITLAPAGVRQEPPPEDLLQQTGHMVTSGQFAIPVAPASESVNSTPRGQGRGRPRGSRGRGRGRGTLTTNGDAAFSTPTGTPGPGRPRGRGRGGRPRGSGRGRGGRGGKRKRGDSDDDQDDEGGTSDSDDEITVVATETRSGRSIQKPTNFVPPPPSPTTNKRKRAYNYRNPQAAVCKVCLRGTSPASNPVVFCDGCNAPYHRWCHKPSIDQAVIDKEDAEWYCRQCAATRVVPVPMTEVAEFVSVTGASEDQRRKYFASLPPGMLVTLLTKATTFRPDLPLFDSRFKELVANPQSNGDGHSMAGPLGSTNVPGPSPDDVAYTDDVHPENYPRPGKGLMSTLPPETEDLEWLVDDDDKYGVFTHLYHEPAKAQPPAPPKAASPVPHITARSTPLAAPSASSAPSAAAPSTLSTTQTVPSASPSTGGTAAPTTTSAESNGDGLV